MQSLNRYPSSSPFKMNNKPKSDMIESMKINGRLGPNGD